MLRRLFFCNFGLHHRNGKRAYFDEHSTVRAPCKYCGVPMEKNLHGKWRVSSQEPSA